MFSRNVAQETQNSGRCSSKPLLAGIGSMMTAAISLPYCSKYDATCFFIVQLGNQRMFDEILRDSCGEGVPNVTNPEPALTSR